MPLARDELVAIVDSRNNVVGTAPRHRMRAENLAHRATYILVFDSSGRLYVQKRTMAKDLYPGYWDPCTGGVVLADESYEESSERELAEEMGIRGVPLEALGDFFFDDPGLRVWGRVFRCVWDGDLDLEAQEVDFVEFMTPQEVLDRSEAELFTPDGILVVRCYCGLRIRGD